MSRRGIPTLYNGTRFRSRLEARWAVFFDAVGWPWAYEPIDLDGYIPDFILRFDHAPIAVEVKPIVIAEELWPLLPMVQSAGWQGEMLALGATVWPFSTDPDRPQPTAMRAYCSDVLGAHGEAGAADDGAAFVSPGYAEIFRCINCGHISLKNSDHGWKCRVRGCYDGNAHVGFLEEGELAKLWASAGNRVQWRGADNHDEVRR